jgi:hypothetical protein
MKKISISIIVVLIISITSNAQTGARKSFSLLNQKSNPQSGLQSVTATIQKTSTVVIPEVVQLGTPVPQPAAKPKSLTEPSKLKREVTNDYNIFILTGASSTIATTSLQAKFGFDGNASDSANIELYKLEVKDGNRIFSVIPGKTLAEKISIHFLEMIPYEGGGTKGDPLGRTGVNQVKLSGYLTQGEYVFIDKASISADGTQINCYAFKIL